MIARSSRDPVGGRVVGRRPGRRSARPGGGDAGPTPSPDSASASRSAPSFAAQPPQSVSSVRRIGGSVESAQGRMIGAGSESAPASDRARQPLASHHRGSGGVPVGPLVFKTSGAALGAAWWVRLPCAPARRSRCRPRRDPAHRASSGPRGRPGAAGRADAATSAPRRAARGRGRRARAARWRRRADDSSTHLADEVAARLDGLGGRARARDRRSTRPASSSTRTWAARRGRGRRSRPREAAARDYLLLELDRDTGRRGRPVPRGRGAPDRADRRRGRARHEQQRGGAWRSPSASPGGAAASPCRAGELVEIGGGVRIPEIIRRAGAKLDRGRDDEPDAGRGLRASRSPTAGRSVVLRVHPSNFRQEGFTEAPDPRRSPALAHEHGAIVVDDLGSGALLADRALRARPRADALRAARGRRRHRHVQRRQARRRAAGRARRRPGGPGRADAARSAGPGDAAGQGDARGGRRDARAVPGRPGRGRGPGLADDRRRRSTRLAARATAIAAGRRRDGSRSSPTEATVGGGSLPGRDAAVVRASRSPAAGRSGRSRRCGAGSPAVIGRIEGGAGRARPADRRAGSRRRRSRRPSAAPRSADADDRRRRDRRPHRPRQDDAAPGADRHRRRPAARGAAAGDDDRRRVRPPDARRRHASSTSSTCRGTTG